MIRSHTHPDPPSDRSSDRLTIGATVARAAAAALAFGLAFGSAASCAAGRDEAVIATVLSYNVQNLFNGTDDGGEYREFTRAEGWSRDRYFARLERLDATVRRLSAGRLPDVIVFQELEGAGIGRDIARDFLRGHRHVLSGPAGETATQVVMLSRLTPTAVSAHRVCEIAVVPGERGRPLWTSRVAVDATFAGRALRVIGAHWKSQSGGEAVTEPKRIREAALVRDVLACAGGPRDAVGSPSPLIATLLVGDLNEDLDEYRSHGGAWPTALVRCEDLEEIHERHGPVAPGIVFAPADAVADGAGFRTLWSTSDAPGTYSYRGEWERLDQAFLAAPPEVGGELRVGLDPELLFANGTPARYDSRSGSGCSDHLPIVVTLTRRRAP
ncbi:MAG: endonuclease/exonuclease/phosphatase family protein [Spirochaetota bacterium]